MREIETGMLWIGNAPDGHNVRRALDSGIRAIIDLAMEERPSVFPRELIHCRFPLVDGPGNPPAVIAAAVNTAVTFVTAELPTLIACGAGMSRSPAIAAAVVARLKNIPPDEAMKRVAAAGPHDVAPLLWKEVKEAMKTIGGTEQNRQAS